MQPSEEKTSYIKANYEIIGLNECVSETGLTRNQVRYIASTLYLKDPNAPKKWTIDEVNILTENLNINLSDLSKKLNKSVPSICKMIDRLKLKRTNHNSLILIKDENMKMKNIIIKYAYSGYTILCEQTGFTKTRVKNCLSRQSFKFRNDKWHDKDLDFIVENSTNIRLCCETLKRSEDKIIEKLNYLGLLSNNTWLNEYRDIKSLSEFKCYLLGYLWADGHVGKNNTTLNIIKSDAEFLRNEIESLNQNWKFNNNKRNIVIANNTVEFGRILKKYDYKIKSQSQPRKLLKELSKTQTKYFFLGLSDGDGCFYLNKKNGTYQYTVNSVYDQDWTYIEKVFKEYDIKYSIQRIIRRNMNSKSSCIRITNKADVIKWGTYLYEKYDLNKIGLYRKYDKFKQISQN